MLFDEYKAPPKWHGRLAIVFWILLLLGLLVGLGKIVHDFRSQDVHTRAEAHGFVYGFLTGFSRLPGGII
jgi:hypothetical protein